MADSYLHAVRKFADRGLQLRLPVDLVPTAQYGKLTNAVPVIEGELRARAGLTLVSRIAPIANVASLQNVLTGQTTVNQANTISPHGFQLGDEITLVVVAVTGGSIPPSIFPQTYAITVATISPISFTFTPAITASGVGAFNVVNTVAKATDASLVALPDTVIHTIFRLNQALASVTGDRLVGLANKLYRAALPTGNDFYELVTGELHSWELTVFSGDWRERKAPRVIDPARAQAVSAAGREQYAERLAENRQRFLGQCGGLAARAASERGWPQIVAFGAPEHVRSFREAIPSPAAIEVGGEVDLVWESPGRLEAPVAEAIERLDEERDRWLAERALDEARGGMRGTAGPQETLAALEEGRVDRLVIDAARVASTGPSPVMRGEEAGEDGAIDSESLVRRALAGGARIATVSGEAAELLAPVDGVAALLRY